MLQTTKNDLYPLLKLAIPLVLTGIMQSSVFFLQTAFLAHLGQQQLAASALVNWSFTTLAALLFGTLSSINILVSHKHGAKDHMGISLVVRDGLLLAIILAIPAFLLFWNMSPIFLLFGQHPSIVSFAEPYLHALAWGLLPNFIMIALIEFIIGLGHARIVMSFTVLSVCLNIVFSYVLIFGKFGLPSLGITGAGWGTTISYWITVIMLAGYVLTNKNYKHYFCAIFKKSQPSFLWELLHIGGSMGLMYFGEVGFFFVLTLIMGTISSQSLAANQIVFQYMLTLMAVIFSIAQAATVRMGHLLGAKEIILAKRAGYMGVVISGFFMGIIAIIYWFFPLALISVDFNIHHHGNIQIISDITKLFAVCALFQIFEAMRIAFFGALRALKDTHFTLAASLISFWCIGLPIGYLLATYSKLGGVSYWWGMVMGAAFCMLLLKWRFKIKIQRYLGTEKL